MLDGVGWNLFQIKFFIQHFLASNTKNTCWICVKRFTTQYLILNTIENVDFNFFECSNVYSNAFIKNNKRWLCSFSSQFYSASIMSSSEEDTRMTLMMTLIVSDTHVEYIFVAHLVFNL